MTWYNKDHTKFLDFTHIGFWEFFPSKYLNEGPHLVVCVDGHLKGFEKEEAEEIYKMLINPKKLLKG